MNGRIYPERAFNSELLRIKYDSLSIVYQEEKYTACYDIENVKKIKDRGHARAIRRKTGFNEVIPGDIFYNKLWILSFGKNVLEQTGMAIVRNGNVIFYNFSVKNPNESTRKIIFEKHKRKQTIIYDFINFFK